MSNEDVSRRLLIRGSALVGLTALIEACSSDPVAPAGDSGTDAARDVPGNTDASTDTPGQPDASGNGDVTILNALLSAEYGAIKAYDAGAMILAAPSPTDPQATQAPVVLAIAMRWQQQHRDHAAQLVAAITAAGGTPVMESAVMFTAPPGFTPSVANVLKLACNAEKGAAVAYNGAVAGLTGATRRFLASTIEGDETQHYIVLYLLLKGAVTPNAAALLMPMGIPSIVPASFVSNVGTGTNGLQGVPDLTYS